jgi:hypothetical protein
VQAQEKIDAISIRYVVAGAFLSSVELSFAVVPKQSAFEAINGCMPCYNFKKRNKNCS